MEPNDAALVLAAGQGKRMRSRVPKVLHLCHELPMVCHGVARALEAGCAPVVVVCSPRDREAVGEVVAAHFPGQPVRLAVQEVARGTGDAARAGLTALPGFAGRLLVLYGDTPLLSAAMITRLAAAAARAEVAFLSARLADPRGYGRVVRDAAGRVRRIVEDRDAQPDEAKIDEVNAGVYWLRASALATMLAGLTTSNQQGELYLTDCVERAAHGGGAEAVVVEDVDDIRGVNSRHELAQAEAVAVRRTVRRHQDAGVRIDSGPGVFIGPRVELAPDSEVGMGVQLRGRCRLAAGARVEGPAVLVDSVLEAGAVVRPFSHLEGATLAAGAQAGPMARLRPGADLGERARVGNFVEVKAARLESGAKVGHLSYIGDARVGAGSNVGAGTITCNYDGTRKHHTEIGAGVFVGSHATLVAPVELGPGAFVAAGSVITDNVGEGGLAFGRARQANYPGRAQDLRRRLSTGSPPDAAQADKKEH